MKSITRFAKRALSLVICLTMVLTTMLFFDIGITKSEAAVKDEASDMDDFLFYVPEVIYLRPVSSSWGASTTSKFHYFIENTVIENGTLLSTPKTNTTAGTEGHIYFKYKNAEYKDLKARWLDIETLSEEKSGGDLILSSAGGSPDAAGGMWATISREMTSPSLSSSETGCVIEWTLIYHDKSDNLDKAIVAYTYVYKPYVVPIAAGIFVENDCGIEHWASNLSWISGFHTMPVHTSHWDGVHEVKYSRYSTYNGNGGNTHTGMLPFITNDLQGINGSTAVGTNLGQFSEATTKSEYAAQKPLYFASTNTEYSFFRAMQEGDKNGNHGIDNVDSNQWHANSMDASTTPSQTSTFDIPQHAYTSITSDALASPKNCSRLTAYESNGRAGIYIDTSRYTNLAQIPNLGVGLMVTSDSASDDGAWMVGDFTNHTGTTHILKSDKNEAKYSGEMSTYWSQVNHIIAACGSLASPKAGYELDGVKYAGTWDCEVNSSVSTYKVKMVYYNRQGNDSIMDGLILGMNATHYNKANLRTAVNNAAKEFARLGIYDRDFNSHYYNNTGKFDTFVSAYKEAYKALVALDKAPSAAPDTLASNLNTALNNLKNDTACRKTGKATQYNVGVILNASGDYRTVTIPNSKAIIKEDYYLGNKVEFTAEEYNGYSFLGKYKLSEAFDANGEKQLFSELYDVVASTLPEATHGGNRKNVSLDHDDKTHKATFTQLSTVSTSTAVATFADDNTTVTYNYAYDTDITYVYFYILKEAEVLFGNEFDFDEYRWNGFSNGTMDVDRVNNVLTINSGSGTDVYTNNYDSLATQRAYMTLVPGRRYELSYDFKNESSSEVTLRPLAFFFNSETATKYDRLAEPAEADRTKVPSDSTVTDKFTFMVPTDYPYVTIRLGFLTANVKCQISNIAVRDISTFTPTDQTNDVAFPDSLHLDGPRGTTFTSDSFPTTSRPGYVFGGWSEDRAANGNGDSANIVDNVTVPADKGNKKLYAVWQTNITYDLAGGRYRQKTDPLDPADGRDAVQERFNIDVNQNIAVSNRRGMDYQVNDEYKWNSKDLADAFVPYNPGYNFGGWKVKQSSIEPTMRDVIYWPGQTVNTCANVEFEAVWKPAYEPDETTGYYDRISSAVNNTGTGEKATFYPGQVHYFKYSTPARNQYISAYTYSSSGDLIMQMLDSNYAHKTDNDNCENSYGIKGMSSVDPMIVTSLNENSTYYFGVSLKYIADTVVDGTNFEITEHTVEYKLQPNGGEIVDLKGDGTTYTNATQTLIGYDNEQTDLPSNGQNYGYELNGWQTVSGTIKTYNKGTPVSADENHSLIANNTTTLVTEVALNAIWSPKPFNVTYDLNKGNSSTTPTMTSSSSTLWFKTPGTLTTDEPSMPGYTFKGWAETPNKVENETLYKKDTATGLTINGDKAESFFRTNHGAGITLYARWEPNLIIVHFKPSEYSAEEEIRNFRFDEQKTLDPMQFNEAEQHTVEFYNEGVKLESLTQMADLVLAGWTNSTGEYKYYLNNDKTLTLLNPNGETGNSDTVGTDTYLYAFWKNAEGNDVTDATTITSPVWERTGYVLAGWADPNDADSPDTTTVDYVAGSKFVPQGDMQLHAVWQPTATADTNEKLFDGFDDMQPVIQGVIFNDSDNLEDVDIIEAVSVPQYNSEKIKDYETVVNRYKAAKAAFESNKSAENNNELYAALKQLESFKLPTDADATDAVKAYLSQFKIQYAPGVEGKVPAGTHSLADMNLNHYTEGLLELTKDIYDNALTVESIFDQKTVNDAVVSLAQAYANKQTLEDAETTYQLYETAGAINASGLKETLLGSEDITAVNYVYTGKGNYTYYCYTNTKTPKVVLTVDEATDATATVAEGASAPRVCYPTTVKYEQLASSGLAESPTPVEKKVTVPDNEIDKTVLKYLSLGLDETATDYEEKLAARKSKYATKAAMVLEPDFSKVADETLNATVTYTLKAHNDAFAGKDNEDIKYAGSAALASGDRIAIQHKADSQGNVATPEDTITIVIDYHVNADGVALDVKGEQVQDDSWLKQYHLKRTSGGAGNWDMVKRNDTVYTFDDPTYGQTNYGAFTYTFRVGAANDFANCVLTSADVETVKDIVNDHYDEIRSVPFTSAKATTRFAHEKDADGNEILVNGKPKVYVETVPAGTGLGFKEWPQSTWSYNYYPASSVYTYVHIADRWGNVVDKVIATPNVDANAVQFMSQSVGDVTAAELGGSGIDTMTISAPTFDIITDENSTFDGETYTTTGNTIKLYTGEANKKYNLTANDVATNAAKGTATTDADGYLTITVEDLAFDTQSGAYTFALNDKTIVLYAEVEDIILSAEDVTVDAGEKAIVSVTTTTAPTMVQLVSESGTTATAIEYTEDEDGNRVWQIGVKMAPGSYEYEVKAKVDGKWISEGETVTVTVIEPTVFVGAVTAVEYTPSTSTRNEFMFTVTGRPDKIQVIEPDGGTRTYDRYHAKVVIVSYDEEGNVIGSMSRDLCYEVWTIEMNVPADIELTAIARYGRAWSTDAPYKYTVVLAAPEFDDEVYSMELASTQGRPGKVQATVITGLDVKGVRFVMDNDTTTTYYTATEADGKLTYVGNAWMNHYGENIIIVKIRVNNAWLNAGELTYTAI